MLVDTMRKKWMESTSGPPKALTQVMEAEDPQFRDQLKQAQLDCGECKPLIDAQRTLLGATAKQSTTEEEKVSKDYRFHPVDGLLERRVYLVQTEIWVPVMPTTVMPPSCFQCPREGLTWRRFAFECAHSTFLEPHRSSGSTWQALKRMAFWLSLIHI